jgi:hypothetical protein
MSPEQILTYLSIGAVIVTALFFLIDSRIGKVLQELKPNGGQSARDALDRIERKIDQVEDKVESHIEWHMNQKGT